MKIKKETLLMSLAVGIVATMATSCTQTGHNGTITTEDTVSHAMQQAYNQAKAVFYALPSPVETATTLESLEVKFNGDVLNNTANSDKYNTASSQAMNLGIYSADLSFCALYEQNQLVIDYLASVKKLAEQLGIVGFFNDSTITTIQNNINNKNKIVGIVSESFTRSTNFLEEQERAEIASTVIVGGWIESLFITMNMLGEVDKNKHSNDINEIMLNQQYTLEDLIGILKLFDTDNYIAQLETQMINLKKSFDEMDGAFTQEGIDKITNEVNEIRTNYIQ